MSLPEWKCCEAAPLISRTFKKKHMKYLKKQLRITEGCFKEPSKSLYFSESSVCILKKIKLQYFNFQVLINSSFAWPVASNRWWLYPDDLLWSVDVTQTQEHQVIKKIHICSGYNTYLIEIMVRTIKMKPTCNKLWCCLMPVCVNLSIRAEQCWLDLDGHAQDSVCSLKQGCRWN